jgi:hypothetical protein
MHSLMRIYVATAPELFWPKIRERGGLFWQKIGSPDGRRAEFEARMERKLRRRLSRSRHLSA